MRYTLKGWFLFSFAALVIGCGSTKNPTKTVLVRPALMPQLGEDPAAVAAGQTTLFKASDTVPAAALSPNVQGEWGPEEALREQKRTGMYRSADWAPAMHYDLRRPNYVIIHHTAQHNVAQTIRTFQVPHSKVSAHYVIGKDGRVIQMLNDYDRAWHAGKSKWGNLTDINSASIGIELDNNGREMFPEEQIQSLLILLDTLKAKYYIPQLNFIGHADIAPTRKDDPNITFPWKTLAQRGFGVWYNEDYMMNPPANFNPMDALKIMGYDMSNPTAAIQAFKRKFIVKEVNSILTEYDIKVLYDLYRKYY